MQNSEAEDGADEPVKEEARRREIIKGNATNGVRYGRAYARALGTKTVPAFWVCAAKLNSHYWHTGQRGKSLLTFD